MPAAQALDAFLITRGTPRCRLNEDELEALTQKVLARAKQDERVQELRDKLQAGKTASRRKEFDGRPKRDVWVMHLGHPVSDAVDAALPRARWRTQQEIRLRGELRRRAIARLLDEWIAEASQSRTAGVGKLRAVRRNPWLDTPQMVIRPAVRGRSTRSRTRARGRGAGRPGRRGRGARSPGRLADDDADDADHVARLGGRLGVPRRARR